MTDDELDLAWAALEPDADARRRMNGRVFSWIEAHDTSLAAEWIGLFGHAPWAAAGLATLGALAILAATPVAWLVRALV